MMVSAVDAELTCLPGAIFRTSDGQIKYSIRRSLGGGVASVCFLATRETFSGTGTVIVKVMRPELVRESNSTGLLMVKKESVALTRLNESAPPTPFVVRLFETGSIRGVFAGTELELPWLALEYVNGGAEGTTLLDRVAHSISKTGYAFAPDRAAHMISCLTKGIDGVHGVEVIHRNVSPRNVLCCGFGEDEVFKIADFGAARPQGNVGTFLKLPEGTPGYVAPELVRRDDSKLGTTTDIFSIACIIFHGLTGEALLPAKSSIEGLAVAERSERRSVLDCEALAPELRRREKVCREIDSVIRLATDPDPTKRPPNGMLLRRALMMSWSADRRGLRATKAQVASVIGRDEAAKEEDVWNWHVRHKGGDSRLIRGVAWEGDGTAMAVTEAGLEYWNGARWLRASNTGLPAPEALHFVQRVDAGLWLIGGDGAALAHYAHEGLHQSVAGGDLSLRFTHASGDKEKLLVGTRPGMPPSLHATSDNQWLPAVELPGVAVVAGLARLDADSWLIVGRSDDGIGFASRYSPQARQLSPIAHHSGGAFLACATQPEIALAVAVGMDGHALRISSQGVAVSTAEKQPLLSAVAVDIDANAWATSQGRIWQQTAEPGAAWTNIWHDATWTSPFVAVFADVGQIVAMTVDGGIIEGRASGPRSRAEACG